jgi:hypothetical protein
LPVRYEPITSRQHLLLWTLFALIAAAVYLLRLDRIVGLMGDDGWYALLGMALAEGRGYTLISSAVAEILPMYPPGYPALLAIALRVVPEFPQNLWLLKGVSLVAMGTVAVLTYRYLVEQRQLSRDLAACCAAATVFTPAFVFLATSTLMSECVFTALQILTVLFIERAASAERDEARVRCAAYSGVAAAATILTRTAGVAVLAAGVLYLAKKRSARAAAVYAVLAGACLAPWWAYTALHAPTAAARTANGGQISQPYSEHFWRGADGTRRIGPREFAVRIRQNVWNMLSRDAGGIIAPIVYRGPSESGQETIDLALPREGSARSMGNTPGTVALSCVLSGLMLLGFGTIVREGRGTVTEFLVPISCGVAAAWPFPTFRLVLPLTPFLLVYLLEGLRVTMRLSRTRRAPLRIAVLTIIGLHLFDHLAYVALARGAADGRVYFADQFQEVDDLVAWMRTNLREPGAVATDRPALVYLLTGRKTVAIDNLDDNWERWRALGVRYVVSLAPSELPNPSHGYRIRFQPPSRRWVIEVR